MFGCHKFGFIHRKSDVVIAALIQRIAFHDGHPDAVEFIIGVCFPHHEKPFFRDGKSVSSAVIDASGTQDFDQNLFHTIQIGTDQRDMAQAFNRHKIMP